MFKRIHCLFLAIFLCFSSAMAAPAPLRRITLSDHLDHTWRDELIRYRVEFEAGQVRPDELAVLDKNGKTVPIQLTGIGTHADGSLAEVDLWLLVDELPAGGRKSWKVVRGERAPAKTDLSIEKRGNFWQIETGQIGVRILAGRKKYKKPLRAEKTPVPLAGIRLQSGKWIGNGRWQTERGCTGYRSEVLARGPLFAEIRTQLHFTDDRHYTATYRVIAGQEVVLVEEEFNLGAPDRYVIPNYGPKQRLLWEWWGGTHGRAESANNFLFSICQKGTFVPSTARWMGHHSTDERVGSPRKNHRIVDYAIEYAKDRLDIVLNSYLQWGNDESVFYAAWNKEKPKDAISVVAIRPSKWIHPDLRPHDPAHLSQFVQTNNIQIRSADGPDLYLRAPVNMGKRAYLLATLDGEEDIPEDPLEFSRIGELLVKYGHKPLDKIKDWILKWDGQVPHPRLFCKPGDMKTLSRRIESQAKKFRRRYSNLYTYLTKGDREAARKAFQGNMSRMRRLRDGTLEGYGPHTNYLSHMVWGIRMHQIAAQMDVLLASDVIDEKQREEARALLAYIGHCAWDKDHFPGRNQGFAWGAANMATNTLTARGMWGDLLAAHPLADKWAEEGARFPVYNLERYLHPESGVTQECPGYAGVDVTRDLVALQALQNRIDLSPILPRLKGLARWRLTAMPPPDVRFGHRTLLTLGDTPYHGDNILGLLGMVLRPSSSDLAQQCLWAYRKSGGVNKPMFRFVIDNSLPGAQPEVESRRFEGFGTIMRSGSMRDDEPFLCHYHGDFSWGHYHTDQGELIFYAKGAPLMMDFGSQYVPNIRQACFHNIVTFNNHEPEEPETCPGRGKPGCFYTGQPWVKHEVEPYTCLQYSMKNSRTKEPPLGRITAFAGLAGADYSRGEQPMGVFERVPYRYDRPKCWKNGTEFEIVEVPRFRWIRQVVLVKDEKDPMGPNYFVVNDDLRGNKKLEPALNLWSLTKSVEYKGNALKGDVTVNGPLHLPGQWGVDLDIFVARPESARIHLAELGYRGRRYDREFRPLHGRKFEERQKLVRVLQEPGGSFTVAVYPRKPKGPKPVFSRLKGATGVKVEVGGQTHWVILSPRLVSYKEGPLDFRGTAGVVKKHSDGTVKLDLLAPGRLSYGELELREASTSVRSRP
ncbi:MAG: hypothetical protein KGZ25_02630 [Planctomycetes bacterium]|nr:hypothetical protein [Planctomycetota bacterium]